MLNYCWYGVPTVGTAFFLTQNLFQVIVLRKVLSSFRHCILLVLESGFSLSKRALVNFNQYAPREGLRSGAHRVRWPWRPFLLIQFWIVHLFSLVLSISNLSSMSAISTWDQYFSCNCIQYFCFSAWQCFKSTELTKFIDSRIHRNT